MSHLTRTLPILLIKTSRVLFVSSTKNLEKRMGCFHQKEVFSISKQVYVMLHFVFTLNTSRSDSTNGKYNFYMCKAELHKRTLDTSIKSSFLFAQTRKQAHPQAPGKRPSQSSVVGSSWRKASELLPVIIPHENIYTINSGATFALFTAVAPNKNTCWSHLLTILAYQ